MRAQSLMTQEDMTLGDAMLGRLCCLAGIPQPDAQVRPVVRIKKSRRQKIKNSWTDDFTSGRCPAGHPRNVRFHFLRRFVLGPALSPRP